jgi:hypothetical protein
MQKTKNQLIIVEGLTGLGKSTLAHFIARQFQYNGIEASWIHEGEDPHPVSIDIDPDIRTFMAEALEKWNALVAQILGSGAVTVIEASFFNNLIETLFAHCLDRAAILDFGMKLQQVIKPVRPALIYLSHPHIPTALEGNFRNRGPGFQDFVIQYVADTPIAREKNWNDYAGMVTFWREFAAITDSLFHEYEIDKLILDVSTGNWGQYNQQVLDFLALPWVADPEIDPETAEILVGEYQSKDSGRKHSIQYENGVLVSNVFMNVKTKLIPKDELVFIAEKWHFELCFDLDHTGEAVSFTIGGRDVDYLKAVGLKAIKVIGDS